MKQLLLTISLLLAVPLLTRAQESSSDTTHIQDTSKRSDMAWSEITLASGRKVEGYFSLISIGMEKQIYYCETNPEKKPRPTMKLVKIDNIQSITQRGIYAESLRHGGKSLRILAPRVVDGQVELFVYAEPQRIPVPVPLPGAVAIIGINYTNNHWYLRRNGMLTIVTHSNFQELMSSYTTDCLAIKAQISNSADGFRYKDMPNIVRLYNDFLAKGSTP